MVSAKWCSDTTFKCRATWEWNELWARQLLVKRWTQFQPQKSQWENTELFPYLYFCSFYTKNGFWCYLCAFSPLKFRFSLSILESPQAAAAPQPREDYRFMLLAHETFFTSLVSIKEIEIIWATHFQKVISAYSVHLARCPSRLEPRHTRERFGHFYSTLEQTKVNFHK